jgi:hypothetical protein
MEYHTTFQLGLYWKTLFHRRGAEHAEKFIALFFPKTSAASAFSAVKNTPA